VRLGNPGCAVTSTLYMPGGSFGSSTGDLASGPGGNLAASPERSGSPSGPIFGGGRVNLGLGGPFGPGALGIAGPGGGGFSFAGRTGTRGGTMAGSGAGDRLPGAAAGLGGRRAV
jgi:hypothetical protein